jgi:Xaa-Pro aminopeptidase
MTVIEMGAFGSERDLDGTDPLHRGVGKIRHTPSFLSIEYTQSYDSELALDDIKSRRCRTMGLVNPGGMPHGFESRLQQGLSGQCSIVDATQLVDRHKAVKSEEEVDLIRRTAALQDDVVARVLATMRPGMRDIDITSVAQSEGHKLGSEQGIFLGASARIGTISPFMPRHLQQRTLKSGDHLSLLIEINGPGGFYTEIARTIVLGQASNQLLDGFENVREAQIHTLRQIRPGVSCRDVAQAHDDYMRSRGLPPETRLYAHGQGYDMVERPLIRADESMCFAEGMCLAVHPGYEIPEMFAVICDNYMVGPQGPGECLHQTEKKVFEIAV